MSVFKFTYYLSGRTVALARACGFKIEPTHQFEDLVKWAVEHHKRMDDGWSYRLVESLEADRKNTRLDGFTALQWMDAGHHWAERALACRTEKSTVGLARDAERSAVLCIENALTISPEYPRREAA